MKTIRYKAIAADRYMCNGISEQRTQRDIVVILAKNTHNSIEFDIGSIARLIQTNKFQ